MLLVNEIVFYLFFRGLWNVPYINTVYLLHGSLMKKIQNAFIREDVKDPDMHFAENLRDKVPYAI